MPTTPSIHALREIVAQHQYAEFKWPDEGADVAPLEVDVQTANMLITLYDAINDERKPDLERKLARDRLNFFHAVDIGWKCVTPAH